jgi:hypothetical protein
MHMAFGGDLGAGPYNRDDSVDSVLVRKVKWQRGVTKGEAPVTNEIVNTLAAAVQAWNASSAANPGQVGVIAILDNYVEELTGPNAIEISEGSLLLVVAADWPKTPVQDGLPGQAQRIVGNLEPDNRRPYLRGALEVRGTALEGSPTPGQCVINGMMIEGAVTVKSIAPAGLGELRLDHCTVIPPVNAVTVALSTPEDKPQVAITLYRTICGPVILPASCPKLVVLQQGRVQLDADWNEQNQIESYRTETSISDLIGKSGGPLPGTGFEIKVTATKKELRFGAGHYYVDGILCELELEIAPDSQEDLPSTAKVITTSTGPVAYTNTPETGIYLAYLDVWLHHLTAIERPEIRESALGGPDHATREKVMAHVKLLRVAAPGANVNSISSTTVLNAAVLNAITAPNLGKLNARTRPGKTSLDPCIVNPGAGYRRLENQLYRIEIHQSGSL